MSWGLLFFEGIGWIVLAGALFMVWYTTSMISVITDSKPVTQLTEDMTGIVRLEGTASGPAEHTDEGILRGSYTLLQKESFRWECSRSGCDYKLNDQIPPKVWGTLYLNGVEVQAERYRFYSDWLPLDRHHVELEHVSRLDNKVSTRPLLIEKPEHTAYSYHGIEAGDRVSVIGKAWYGKLEPFELPGSESDQPVLLIGANVEDMVSKERGIRNAYLILSAAVALFLMPVNIRRLLKIVNRLRDREVKGRSQHS